jgi:acetoin utilization protein AcuB
MKVSDYMTRDVYVARPGDGARETFGVMRVERIRHLPVVDDEGAIVGVVSDRDLRRPRWVDTQVGTGANYALDDDIKVADVMSDDVIGVRANDTLEHAARIFVDRRVGILPVLNADGELAGVLSPIDLCKAVVKLLAKR